MLDPEKMVKEVHAKSEALSRQFASEFIELVNKLTESTEVDELSQVIESHPGVIAVGLAMYGVADALKSHPHLPKDELLELVALFARRAGIPVGRVEMER